MDDRPLGINELAQQGRDLWARLGVLEEELRQQRALANRLSAVEDALREMRESLLGLQQQLAASQEQSARQALVRAAEADRDRKTLTELEQQVAELRRLGEANHGRILLAGEEAKRDRALLADLPRAIEDLSRRHSSQVGRVQQLEEQGKRTDGRLADVDQRDGQLRAELARLDNWQRLADVRWSRQLGEWQQQITAWKEQADGQSRQIQQLTRQVTRAQDDLQALFSQVTEHQKAIGDQVAALQRAYGLLTAAREGSIRSEQAIDTQRRRVDELVAGHFRLEERLQSDIAQLGDLMRRVDGHDVRLEEIANLVQGLDTQRQRTEHDIAAVQQQLRQFRSELGERASALWEQLLADRQMIATRLAELGRILLEQRQRYLAAIQQEIAEWTELTRSDGGRSGSADTPTRVDRPSSALGEPCGGGPAVE